MDKDIAPGRERAMMAARTLMAAIKNTQRRTNFQLQRGLPLWLPSLLVVLVDAELRRCGDDSEEFEDVSIVDVCTAGEGGLGAI